MMTAEKYRLTVAKPGGGHAVHHVEFTDIYMQHFRQTEAYILQNNGSPDDAKDIFQEVLIILLARTREPDFVLTSSLATYLLAISRNLWLNKLREKSRMANCTVDIIQQAPADEVAPVREGKLHSWINLITLHCQHIIRSIFFLHEPMDSLSARMGWKNRHTADNQKYKCIRQLKKISHK